jgi:hypothetical protein
MVAYFAVVWGALRQPGGVLSALYGVLLVFLLFALVVIHELTHARVAQHYGILVATGIGSLSAACRLAPPRLQQARLVAPAPARRRD